MTQSSFYSDTPNYATSIPNPNDPNTNTLNGNTQAHSSFYPGGGAYTPLSTADAVASAAGTQTPLVDGVAAVGTSAKWAHEDHVHPTDTSRAPLASPGLTGTPTAPTATNGDNSTKIATTAFVLANGTTLSGTTPSMNGAAAVGTENAAAHGDHVHPTDTSRAPLASPNFTGTISLGGVSFATLSSPYNILYDGSSRSALYLGGTGDPTNYYRNSAHYFQSVGASSTYATLNSTGLALTGTLAVTGGGSFTISPTAPTPTTGDSSTKLATTAFVANPANTSFTQNGTSAVAETLDAMLRDRIFYVEMFGAVSSPLGTAVGSIADSSAAIQAAINRAAAIGGGVVLLGPGAYKTIAAINIASNNVFIRGSGVNQTVIVHAPTGAASCFYFSAGASVLYNTGISDLSIESAETTFTKFALNVSDTSQFVCRNINVAHYSIDGTLYRGGSGSTALYIQGREMGVVENFQCYAEQPIHILVNPNSATISLDSWVFRNLYLVNAGSTGFHSILVDPSVVMTNVTFDGHQNWVGGVDGFHWVDAGSVTASMGLYIRGVKAEQTTNSTGYTINIQHNTNLWGLKVEDCIAGDRGGIELRKVRTATIDNFFYDPIGTNKNGLNIDSTAQFVALNNCWWNTNTTASITGQVLTQVDNLVSGLSTAIPNRGTYTPSGAWTSYTPTLTSEAGGALGSGNTLTGFYRLIGKTCHVRITIVMGASGVGTATQASVSLPFTAQGDAALAATDRSLANCGIGDIGRVSQARAILTTNGGGILLVNSHTIIASGTYEAA